MNRTIKEATVRRYHYDSHNQLEQHLQTFLAAYNYAKRLKTLKGLTPYEYICKCWTETPDRFRLSPHHHTPGLNNLGKEGIIFEAVVSHGVFQRLVRRVEPEAPCTPAVR